MVEFCEIYCKEDYDITVPYKRQTQSGRFFQIDVDIKGTQTCYSTKINSTQFEKDNLANIFQKQINYYYNFYLNKIN